MYKNMIPADVIARERHPMEQTRCYSGPVDVDALQQQLAEQHERYLRVAADFENFKKRTAHEVEKRATAQKEVLVRDLLPVFDNLDRALAQSAPALTDPLRQGVEMTFHQFIDIMRKHRFEPREDIGEPFDSNFRAADETLSCHWRRFGPFGNRISVRPGPRLRVVHRVLRKNERAGFLRDISLA
jgi:molecular chaperone GrpE